MKEQTNNEVVKSLLDAKNSMEKTVEFASKSMDRVRAANPAPKMRAVQLLNGIKNLREMKGEPRKTAVSNLAKAMVVPPKPKSRPVSKAAFCIKCGAALTPGAKFCGSCGAKVA